VVLLALLGLALLRLLRLLALILAALGLACGLIPLALALTALLGLALFA
jgi:hypothetical protein